MSDPTGSVRRRSPLLVVALCFLTIVFDGYDLIVYGSIVPSLIDEWGLTPAQAGAIGSYALVGMLIGALGAGVLTDALGRRRILLVGITWFSLAMVACAVAPNPEILGLLRFVAGLGLGGVIPSAIALTVEYAPRGRRQFYNAAMFAGYSVGGVLAAVLALNLVADHGWRLLLGLGAAPLVLVLPLAWWFLPESVGYLVARGRDPEAAATAATYGLDLDVVRADSAGSAENGAGGIRSLFGPALVRATLLFGAASFCGLLLVYGLNTWLPQIMRQAGYPLGSALTFLLVLNLGAIAGALAASTLADRFGPKPVTVAAFVLATACLLVLSQRVGTGLLFVAVAVAGLGSVGTQILVNGYVAVHYPAAVRATGLGWALGVGRAGAVVGPLFGGWVLTSGIGFEFNFYGFAVPALAGALLIALVPRARADAQAQLPVRAGEV